MTTTTNLTDSTMKGITMTSTRNEALLRRAEQIQTRLGDQAAAISGDRSLSDLAKQSRLAKLYLAASAQMDEVRQRQAKDAADHRRAVERKLFAGAPGASPMDQRDAAERADRLNEPQELQGALARADLTADETLASAVAQRALILGRRDVVDAWAASRPQMAEGLQQLEEALHAAGPVGTLQATFATGLPKPSGIDRVSEGQLQALAAQDL